MLRTLDMAIIVVYLLAMAAIGIACRGRQEDENDYFTAGGGFSRLLGTILVGLSIAATYFSGISFLAIPSVVYRNGLAMLVGIALLPISGLIVARWFLPVYLGSGCRQPYEIIERRFGYPTRAVAAAMFVLLRIAWMGTLIYAPTVALIAGMRLDDSYFWPIVLAIGLTSTFYTTLGGVRGVIVTDAVQFIIISLGIVWPVAHVALNLPMSAADAWAGLESSGRLKWFNPSTSFREPFTVWSMIAGFMTVNLGMYMADQMSLQRYLASENLRAARRAFAINIVGVVVVLVLLTAVGLAMAVWYSAATSAAAPERADDVFPYFVVSQLPAGAPGLIIAAILAATMSSMTSGINALAGTITLDFVARSNRLPTSAERLRFGRLTSLVIGAAATFVAGIVGNLGSIFDIIKSFEGLFLGPMLACLVLSIVPLRVSPVSMICGMLAGVVTGAVVVKSPAHSLWVAPATAAVSFIVPLAAAGVRRIAASPRQSAAAVPLSHDI